MEWIRRHKWTEFLVLALFAAAVIAIYLIFERDVWRVGVAIGLAPFVCLSVLRPRRSQATGMTAGRGPRRSRSLRTAGFKILPYTADDPAIMDQLLRLGVDGMISDNSDLRRAHPPAAPAVPRRCH